MTGQQEIGNPILDLILMPTLLADELPFHNVCLEEQSMEIFQHGVIQRVAFWFAFWDGTKA